MNTSLQLYHATLAPPMCPLWPEIPTLEAAPASLSEESKSQINVVYDNLPKTWDDAVPYFAKGFLLYECLLKRDPVNCVSILATKIRLSALPETGRISPADNHRRFLLRYLINKIEFGRINWLLPCTVEDDMLSCFNYFAFGAGSHALKLVEKGEMPKLLTQPIFIMKQLPIFVLKQILHTKAMDTALSCVIGTWDECLTDAAQVLAGGAFAYYCENE